eukprot:TRINITY_DN58066_c0_g1_i1.p1 TRINITY_DN58066_c0_g1~~TRINITY_DN58066_c0_g1_i1.p1  ORF type:complete len:623 (+),score=109.35 TRINITY_DN58066_c0_g1_i1:57-1925(+)
MSDQFVVSDASLALVLADQRHEQSLALFDEGAGKRKARWLGSAVSKKGKRWGLIEDKPFKPLPYVELPVGLETAEVDQFLREQRLEDLHRKVLAQQLEDIDPDIRPPSPPPMYDRQGNRLNTREIRVKKAMMAEYNRLIRYMMKTLSDYVPPEGWRPQRLVKKIIIPYEKWPNASFMGVIIGARGVNHKRLQEATGCRIFIRGKDIGDKFQTDEELQMPQHIHIEGDTEERIQMASDLIMPLLNPESPEFEYARTNGMQQVALVNGFTLKKTEQRCGICGAVGHLGFDCPENMALSYKMADVKCTICGDRGHVASDCKVAAEKHQRENVDWKAEAEKKRSMDAEYAKMMSELGVPVENAEQSLAPRTMPRRVVSGTATGSCAAAASSAACPGGKASCGSDGSLAGAAAAAALLALPAPPTQPGPVFVKAAPGMSVPKPLPAANYMVRPGGPPLPPHAPGRLPPHAPGRPPHVPHVPGVISSDDIDGLVLCPRALAKRLWTSEHHVLADIGRETGAHVSLKDRFDTQGGPYFIMSGHPDARQKAKLHLQAWMDVNLRSSAAGSSQPASWRQQNGGGLPAGFPPGFPAGCLPTGFPPVGFPPGGAQASAPNAPSAMTAEAYDEI